jgi:hypothetical protein
MEPILPEGFGSVPHQLGGREATVNICEGRMRWVFVKFVMMVEERTWREAETVLIFIDESEWLLVF